MSGTHYEEKTFWFTDEESGDEFFVEAENKRVATAIAREYFGDEVKCHGTISREEADYWGYDTY